MGRDYRICVTADDAAIEVITAPDTIDETKSFICEMAADEFGLDPELLARDASVTFVSSESGEEPCLDEYDMILHLEGESSELEYSTRLMDRTYDMEWVTAESGSGETYRMPFGALKGYLMQSCGIVAGMARAKNSVMNLRTEYSETLSDEKNGSFKAAGGSVYAKAEESLARASDDLAKAYADAWEKTVIQFGNVLRLEPKLQFCIFGKQLQYDQEKLDRMKHVKNVLYYTGEKKKDAVSDYEFVITAMVNIYESNRVLYER